MFSRIFEEQLEITESNTWITPMELGIAKVGTKQNWRASPQSTSILGGLEPETISAPIELNVLQLSTLAHLRWNITELRAM